MCVCIRARGRAHTHTFLSILALFWTAPELLCVSIPPSGGSKSADVYAYGIIIQEIATRDRPYGTETDQTAKGKLPLCVLCLQKSGIGTRKVLMI